MNCFCAAPGVKICYSGCTHQEASRPDRKQVQTACASICQIYTYSNKHYEKREGYYVPHVCYTSVWERTDRTLIIYFFDLVKYLGLRKKPTDMLAYIYVSLLH